MKLALRSVKSELPELQMAGITLLIMENIYLEYCLNLVMKNANLWLLSSGILMMALPWAAPPSGILNTGYRKWCVRQRLPWTCRTSEKNGALLSDSRSSSWLLLNPLKLDYSLITIIQILTNNSSSIWIRSHPISLCIKFYSCCFAMT